MGMRAVYVTRSTTTVAPLALRRPDNKTTNSHDKYHQFSVRAFGLRGATHLQAREGCIE